MLSAAAVPLPAPQQPMSMTHDTPYDKARCTVATPIRAASTLAKAERQPYSQTEPADQQALMTSEHA